MTKTDPELAGRFFIIRFTPSPGEMAIVRVDFARKKTYPTVSPYI